MAGDRILVIGDVIRDEFRYGRALGLSAETPTVVMEEHDRVERWGGAALVARYIAARHGKVTLMTLAHRLIDMDDNRVEVLQGSCALTVGKWNPTSKTRFMVDGYKLLQVDQLNSGKHDSRSRLELFDDFCHVAAQAKRVVVADNRHGVIDQSLAYDIVQFCRNESIPLIVDSQVSQKQSNHRWYKGASLICANEREFGHMCVAETGASPPAYSDDVLAFMNCLEDTSRAYGSDIVVKLGENGSIAIVGDKILRHKAVKTHVVDVTGAGDAFLAVLAMDGWDDKTLTDANDYAARACEMPGTETP